MSLGVQFGPMQVRFSMTTESAQPAPERRLGVLSIAFMIVAASAPLTVIAGGAPTSFAVSGLIGVPASYLVLAAVLAVFAFGYAAMARHISNPGAFYAYVSRGLGRPLGVGSAIGAMIAYACMQIGIFAMFGFTIADWLATRFDITTPWWAWVFAGIAVVGLLGVRRIDFSARLIAVLVALEFLVVLVVDVIGLANAPEGYSTAPLSPASLLVPGVGVLLAFGVAAFMGFESAAIYAREAKDPRRTIGRATFLAVVVVGLFYSFSAWALATGVGESQIVAKSTELGPGLVFAVIAENLPVWAVDVANLLFISSLFAALLSFHNAVARYIAELGRERVAHPVFGRRAKNGAPVVGSLTQSLLAVLVTLGFVFADSGDPLFPVLTMFTWLTNTGAFGLVFLMIFVSIAVIGFFRRDARGVGLWARLVAPLLSAIALAVIFVLVLVNFNLLLGQEGVTALTFLLPALVIVPGALGMLYARILKSRDPERYALIGAEEIPMTEPVRAQISSAESVPETTPTN